MRVLSAALLQHSSGRSGCLDSPKANAVRYVSPSFHSFGHADDMLTEQDAAEQVALIDKQLEQLIASGTFRLPGDVNLKDYMQPASIDLPVTGQIFLVKEKVLQFSQRVRNLIEGLTLEEKSLSGKGAVLLKGQASGFL